MINLCRNCFQNALFIKKTVLDNATYVIILSYSLHLKTAFCTVALITVGLYTAGR